MVVVAVEEVGGARLVGAVPVVGWVVPPVPGGGVVGAVVEPVTAAGVVVVGVPPGIVVVAFSPGALAFSGTGALAPPDT